MKKLFGIRAKKTNSEEGDAHGNGSSCVVIAESVATHMGMIYLAIFEDFPYPVATIDYKIKLLTNEKRVQITLKRSQQEYLEPFSRNMFKFYEDDGKEEENDQNHKKNQKKL